VKLPKYIKYLSILNPNLNYINDVTTLKMNSGDINVPIYSDDNLAEDVYSAKNKSFNIVNDSTISLKFLMYIDTGEVNYLIDRNDVNINYHINVSKKNKILNNNTFNLSMYEKITNFSINKLVYVKNIYSDEIVAIGKVININKNDNELIIQSIYNYINDTITITNMDEYILYKIYDCESFKLSEKYDKFKTFLKDDLITFDDLIFSNNDFQIINQLGK
jgi:ArsR family metal-binding transcriptional regulator